LHLACFAPSSALLAPADVDPQYRSDAEQGVLRRYLATAPGELEHRLAVGRLLAGGWAGRTHNLVAV